MTPEQALERIKVAAHRTDRQYHGTFAVILHEDGLKVMPMTDRRADVMERDKEFADSVVGCYTRAIRLNELVEDVEYVSNNSV